MSLSHPYLKQLKVHILRFTQSDESIRDDHPSLLPFCRTLEDILKDGLLGCSSFLTGSSIRLYWQWIVALPTVYTVQKLSIPLQLSIAFVQQCKKVLSERGKGRLFLRLALVKGVLVRALRLLLEHRELRSQFYDNCSILGDDILSEIFTSMLLPLEGGKFALNTRNCAFLDESWELPQYCRYEFVPCKTLGVLLEEIEGRLMVIEVESCSVADEDAKIEAGDIIDELFTESMRGASKRKFQRLMTEFYGAPVYVAVIKCCLDDGTIYRPLWPYLESVGLNKNALIANHRKRAQETCIGRNLENSVDPESAEKGVHSVKLVGYIDVGARGTVEMIEGAVVAVLNKPEMFKREVILQLGETAVTVSSKDTAQIILQHGYPEIASCGRRVDYPLNFAYVAGETTCTIAQKFVCYVFEAITDDQSKTVLQAIAQGFNRTHWAV